MMISDSLETISKIKAMSAEEKERLAKKLDEWTIHNIENTHSLSFSEDGIQIKNISAPEYYIQTDDVFLYHYLLGLPLYITRRRFGKDFLTREIAVKGYEKDGKPFSILCVVYDDEYDKIYKDITTLEPEAKSEKPEDEDGE